MTFKSIAALCGLILFIAGVLGIRAGLSPQAGSMNIHWFHYGEAGLPEQDVFIALGSVPLDPTDPYFLGINAVRVPNVFRVDGKPQLTPANLAKTVYAASTMIPHDPLKLGAHPLGPFNRGDPLGVTLGQWLAARGDGTYSVNGETAELELRFEQLVPNGRYALWCGHTSAAPHYVESEKPCGAANGSQNRFKADAEGNANYHLNLKALPASTEGLTTMLVLSYERDAEPLDGETGGYGLSSHVQLLYAFPTASGAAHACGTESACSGRVSDY